MPQMMPELQECYRTLNSLSFNILFKNRHLSGACGAHWQGLKLDVKGEGEHTRLAGDKLWGDTQ